jgi:hypothetical protein
VRVQESEGQGVVVVGGRNEGIEDGGAIAGDGALDAVGSVKQATSFTQAAGLWVGAELVAERWMLGEKGGFANDEDVVEQREGGELRRSGQQARLERVAASG